MAIKKYHVSKNLFSGEFSQFDNIGGTGSTYGYFKLNSDCTLTVRAKSTLTIESNIYLGLSANGGNANDGYVWSIKRGDTFVEGQEVTIKTSQSGYYFVSLYYNNENTLQWIMNNFDVMLNKGSTVLPYEPYGNTWNTIPYRKYETATDTITSLPADVIADGQSASAVIKGNLSQSGTPTPASPIYPTETGDKTANLCLPIRAANGWVIGYRNGSNGTYVSANNQGEWLSPKIPISAGKTFTVSAMPIDVPSMSIYFWNGNTYIGNTNYSSTDYSGATFTAPTGTTQMDFAIRAGADKKTEEAVISSGFWVMLNTGETALPYDHYGYKIPILSGNTTTNVYLGEVETTRRIQKLVLTGDEDIQLQSTNTHGIANFWFFNLLSGIEQNNQTVAISSHFVQSYLPIADVTSQCFSVSTSSQSLYLRVNASDIPTVTDMETYLQQQYANGTPVCVWYVLAESTTDVVNEPIRKIGTYVDSVSVSNLPTTGTAEQFDVQTDLKPSEVDLTYHGWHEHEPKEYSGGSWT